MGLAVAAAVEGQGVALARVEGLDPAEDRDKAIRFARGVCTLNDGEYDRSGDGPPRLPEALSRFECVTHDRIQMGDHLVIVGRVEAFQTREGDALTFHRGRYGQSHVFEA
ncbi:MAG: flavin reductase [Brevundimonas sp.]|nr:MAG: flavin reductase [Brevundimonas sp.]